MKYIKLIIATLSILAMFNVGGVAANALSLGSAPVRITADSFVGDACGALSQDVSSDGCSKGTNTFNSIARSVVNILSIIIGIVSVIMIIISGFRFVIAGGDANAVSSAKNTLIYAIVGLVIAVLAQFLVHGVLSTANNIQNNSYLNSSPAIRSDS